MPFITCYSYLFTVFGAAMTYLDRHYWRTRRRAARGWYFAGLAIWLPALGALVTGMRWKTFTLVMTSLAGVVALIGAGLALREDRRRKRRGDR